MTHWHGRRKGHETMPRIRYLKPGFFKNEDLAQCTPFARLAFAGLWCWADRDGRLEDRPLRLKAEILPFDHIDFEALLAELAARRFILRYEVDGHKYIAILNFKKHQKVHAYEQPGTIPAPPANVHQHTPPTKDSARTPCAPLAHPLELGTGNGQRVMGNAGATDSSATSKAKSPEPPGPPPVLVFPTVGKGPKEWPLTAAKLAEYGESFPGLDVLAEAKKALQWVRDNRPKTAKGMPKFLNAWMARSNDSGRSHAGTTRPGGSVGASHRLGADPGPYAGKSRKVSADLPAADAPRAEGGPPAGPAADGGAGGAERP